MKFLLLRASGWDHFLEDKDTHELEKIRSAPFFIPSVYPPLGLEYIGATLEQEGHKVEILDYVAKDISREQLEKTLTSSDAVGITFIDNCKPAADISTTIKEINHEIPLIIAYA